MRCWPALVTFLAILGIAAGGRCAAESYRVDGEAASLVEEWRLRVFSLTQEAGEVRLRVGLVNEAEEERRVSLGMVQEGVRLSSLSGSVDVKLEWRRVPANGGEMLTKGEVVVSELRGSWKSQSSVTSMPLTLRCPPFESVTFTPREDMILSPVRLDDSGEPWSLDFEAGGEVEAMANIAMVLRAARVRDGKLELGVAYRNESRFTLNWRANVTGRDARLVSWEGEALEPVDVSGGLRDGISPKGGLWRSGEEVEGTIRFPLPDPLAGQEVRFSFPGYAPVNLLFDPEARQWIAAPRAKSVSSVAGEAASVRAEETLFRELEAFWSDMSGHLVRRDYEAYQGSFAPEGGLRAEQMRFLAGLGSLPVTSLEFHLPARQRLNAPGGQVRGLKVELRYQLAGIPRSNEFVTLIQCDMERRIGERRGWGVTAMKHLMRPPFWTLGFTEVESSEHFLVFHKENVNDQEKARLAVRQMERAYDHLGDEGIPLGPRYAGFVIPDGGDFAALTGRDPVLFSGASSATYVERDGELRVINQALFINDFRFFSLRRLWGQQDRQVTIQHELFHLAMADQTRPWTPAWLVEGAAVVFGGQMKDISSRAPKVPNPEDADLAALSQLPTLGVGALDGDRVLSQYLHSAHAVEWILKNQGKEDLLAFYRSFAALAPAEWRASDGISLSTVTESPTMQAARLRLTEDMMRKHLAGIRLVDLNRALEGD